MRICPQKIKQERDWNFNFRLLSTENCFSLRNQCFAKMRQIHISMIHHKTVTVLLQKYRIDKLSIQYQIQISHFFLLSGQLCLCPLKDSSLLFTQDIGQLFFHSNLCDETDESCALEPYENKPKFDITLATTQVGRSKTIMLHFGQLQYPHPTPPLFVQEPKFDSRFVQQLPFSARAR